MRSQPYQNGSEVELSRGGTRTIESAFWCEGEQRWYFRFRGGGGARESEILGIVFHGVEKAVNLAKLVAWNIFDGGRKYVK